ncbi:microtubule associated protein (Ase1), putative [Talaromyces stipitatus ATCC 10500]|uniref:Microtubule associated protein (Ase1), putative n=1 Tax=Talaromyces stipitatus (strain ATCC 10500 / CBS 375.48 / QM 6759 / NRRL 1006) TaxID=441959 RepID=B8MPY5_TALSN|nr:microtubule associated protein (Ase1), putative [Talaromyces stipitatus ATCC 10500]EED12875.1 microtubule associated protein (Ase1), putative [Talaromyces stipitatus ATCC 10500]
MSVDTSYLTTQVNNIIGQLHGIFDDIGVPNHERETRETEATLSDTLNNHLRIVTTEKEEMIAEAERLIKTIKQMEASLDDEKANGQYELDDGDLRITFPLNRCIVNLKEKYSAISRLHRERFEQVKKLVEALESYSSHLEASFVQIELPPTAPNASIPPNFDLSPSYVTRLDSEFTRVYEEYNKRVHLVKVTSEEIIKLWAELGTPQAQTDSNIVKYYREAPEQLGLHDTDIVSLKEKRAMLMEEKKNRERKLNDLKTAVEGLWERLGVDERDQKAFLAANRGCGLRTINEFSEELERLKELKRQNLHLFVEDARCRLQELWDSLYYSEEEMLDFTPAFSDVYSDALLEAHEAEIARLEAIREQRAPTLDLITRHKALIEERDTLAASSQDASRLMARGNKGEKRDPGKLLREEKMRKRIAKELPKLEVDLRKMLERWEDEYGRPFLVHGERYLEELTPVASKVPPRSKTPSVQPPSAVKSKQASTYGTGSVRGAPPPRSATKTPTGTMRRNAPQVAACYSNQAQAKSPSKIPARVPLSNMPHGNNSPERRQPPTLYSSNTIRGKIPPRAPPPKMRELFTDPNEDSVAPSYMMEPSHCESVVSSRSVRPVSLEDVYDDRQQRSVVSHSTMPRPRTAMSSNSSSQSLRSIASREMAYPPQNPYLSRQPPPLAPAMRQISNSTVQTATSGSENWETYDDDASEPEIDASDVYYAKLRAAHGKRLAPEGQHEESLLGKKMRGIRTVGSDEQFLEHNGQMVRIEGSDGGWTDELETY